MADLPFQLKMAVDTALAGVARTGLQRETAALSQHYRRGGASDHSVSLAAYLAARMPATFAAVSKVLEEVGRRRPDWRPASLLDAGAGPGTASWAATSRWPEIGSITLLDRNARLLALAEELARQSETAALSRATFLSGDLASPADLPVADLVIASYALAEIPQQAFSAAVASLWRAASDMLVLVEPGTPAGFARLRQARADLIRAGAVPLAPCPHAAECPMSGEDWCHFSARLARSRAHMQAKQARVPFEDEKFSYLAVVRQGRTNGGARVLSPPEKGRAGMTFKLCTPESLEMRRIARRDPAAYKAHRKLEWGDFIGPETEDGA